MQAKINSFTLSELLIVMLITAIVVGIAFNVLNLVQKQIRFIENNFQSKNELSLIEQQLWQDFNTHNVINYTSGNLILQSDLDTIIYRFKSAFSLRNNDTIKLKLAVDKVYYYGREVKDGAIDAISISGNAVLPNYSIFVSTENDATHLINHDGL
jgi:hypothetical protein